MILAIAGGARFTGASKPTESQLDRVTNWLRATWRRLIDILNQKGDPL